MVDGAIETKSSREIDAAAQVETTADPNPWVSRGGLKLAYALEAFGLSPEGATVLDVGASTGGFTQVCLANGAARVYALDVGRDQLHPTIASDPRVVELSGLNARDVGVTEVPEPVDWLVSDVSFISLEKALPAPLSLTADAARLVVLVKPQFEVGRSFIGKGGVVRDADARMSAIGIVRRFLDGEGWSVQGKLESPITGADGNVEYLLTAQKR